MTDMNTMTDTLNSNSKDKVVVIEDYVPDELGELTLQVDDELLIIRQNETEGRIFGRNLRTGEEGYYDKKYVKLLDEKSNDMKNIIQPVSLIPKINMNKFKNL